MSSNNDPLLNGQTSAILPDDHMENYEIKNPYNKKKNRLNADDLSASQRNSIIGNIDDYLQKKDVKELVIVNNFGMSQKEEASEHLEKKPKNIAAQSGMSKQGSSKNQNKKSLDFDELTIAAEEIKHQSNKPSTRHHKSSSSKRHLVN